MTRRRDPDTLDLIGFDPIGEDYSVTADERRALLGLGPLCMAVYLMCLKPFAKKDGRIYAQSYYRIAEILRHRREPGTSGPAPAEPTKKQLRTALDALEKWGLIDRASVYNEQRGVLQIWLRKAPGEASSESNRAGNRAGGERAQPVAA